MILIDRRTGSKEFETMIGRQGTPVKVMELDSADFAFDGHGPDEDIVTVGIERKTVPDLLDSFKTGRLTSRQLPKMVDTYDYRYLLVEGQFRPNPYSGVLEVMIFGKWKQFMGRSTTSKVREGFSYSTIAKFLHGLNLRGGMRILYTYAPAHTAQEIVALYNGFQVPWEDHRSHMAGFVKELPPNKRRTADGKEVLTYRKAGVAQRIAKEFDGVGWELAARVSDHFQIEAAKKGVGTVHAMINADAKQWREVDGIGSKIAASVQDEIHGRKG